MSLAGMCQEGPPGTFLCTCPSGVNGGTCQFVHSVHLQEGGNTMLQLDITEGLFLSFDVVTLRRDGVLLTGSGVGGITIC